MPATNDPPEDIYSATVTVTVTLRMHEMTQDDPEGTAEIAERLLREQIAGHWAPEDFDTAIVEVV